MDIDLDITKIKRYLDITDDIQTRMALMRLLVVLKSWRVTLKAKGEV